MTEKLAADSGAERAARRIRETIPRRDDIISDEIRNHWIAIIREETGTQWIPVEERLPENGQKNWVESFCLDGYGTVFAGVYDRGLNRWTRNRIALPADGKGAVIKWHPLPAAPDEGGTR